MLPFISSHVAGSLLPFRSRFSSHVQSCSHIIIMEIFMLAIRKICIILRVHCSRFSQLHPPPPVVLSYSSYHPKREALHFFMTRMQYNWCMEDSCHNFHMIISNFLNMSSFRLFHICRRSDIPYISLFEHLVLQMRHSSCR